MKMSVCFDLNLNDKGLLLLMKIILMLTGSIV